MRKLLYLGLGATLGACAGVAAPRAVDALAEPAPEKPAYLIVLGDVYDRDAFMTGYAAKLGPLYEKYGGEYVALGANRDILENGAEFGSYVISRWPSMDAARAFWNDADYEQLKRDRIDQGWGRFDVYLVEGLPMTAD